MCTITNPGSILGIVTCTPKRFRVTLVATVLSLPLSVRLMEGYADVVIQIEVRGRKGGVLSLSGCLISDPAAMFILLYMNTTLRVYITDDIDPSMNGNSNIICNFQTGNN